MKKRPLTPLSVLLLIMALILAFRNLSDDKNKQETTVIQSTSVLMEKKPQTKAKGIRKEPEVISLEVQGRLTAAGFKKDSFITVKTEKN